MSRLPDLKIGNLKAYPPIVQGGMGIRVSLANLAAAVANEGGIGTIAAGLIGGAKSNMSGSDHKTSDIRELIFQIKKARSLTKGILAVNMMAGATLFEDLSRTAAQEGIDIIFSGGGLPLSLPKYVEGTKTKIAPIVSSGRSAEVICKNWVRKYNYVPDAIVVEGPLAGGHLGYTAEVFEDPSKTPKLEDILTDVLKVAKQYEIGKKIPVIAAGGIYDGKDIARFLKLGASGVQLATRFICTDECDASIEFKQACVNSKKEDICIIVSPLGLPGRAIRNKFLEKINQGNKRVVNFTCNYRCIKPCVPSESAYCIADALINASAGNLEEGFVFCGANVYRCDKIVPVKELMKELVSVAEENY